MHEFELDTIGCVSPYRTQGCLVACASGILIPFARIKDVDRMCDRGTNRFFQSPPTVLTLIFEQNADDAPCPNMLFGPVGKQLKPTCRDSWTCAQGKCLERRYPLVRGPRANRHPSSGPRTHMRHRRVPNCAPWRRFGAAPRTDHSAARTRPQCPACRWNIARLAETLRAGPQIGAGSRASSTPSRRR